MSILACASKPEREPFMGTIVGTPGSGKSSLAATFPKPLFIRTTGESVPKDIAEAPDVLPEMTTADELWEVLKALATEEHDYRTAVIDSATGLEQLFVADVMKVDNKARSINQALGGYGAGPAAVAAMHARVRRAAEVLRKKRGLHVIFLAHADIARIDPPDSDGYSQYTLRLPGKSVSAYVDNVDLVGFLKQSTILRGDEGSQKKAITTGERVLVTYMTPSTVAKNRFGIEEDIDVTKGANPLAFLIEGEPAKNRRRKPSPTTENTEQQENNQ